MQVSEVTWLFHILVVLLVVDVLYEFRWQLSRIDTVYQILDPSCVAFWQINLARLFLLHRRIETAPEERDLAKHKWVNDEPSFLWTSKNYHCVIPGRCSSLDRRFAFVICS